MVEISQCRFALFPPCVLPLVTWPRLWFTIQRCLLARRTSLGRESVVHEHLSSFLTLSRPLSFLAPASPSPSLTSTILLLTLLMSSQDGSDLLLGHVDSLQTRRGLLLLLRRLVVRLLLLLPSLHGDIAPHLLHRRKLSRCGLDLLLLLRSTRHLALLADLGRLVEMRRGVVGLLVRGLLLLQGRFDHLVLRCLALSCDEGDLREVMEERGSGSLRVDRPKDATHRLLEEAHRHQFRTSSRSTAHGKDDHPTARFTEPNVAHGLLTIEIPRERVVALLASLTILDRRAGLVVGSEGDARHATGRNVALDLVQLKRGDGRQMQAVRPGVRLAAGRRGVKSDTLCPSTRQEDRNAQFLRSDSVSGVSGNLAAQDVSSSLRCGRVNRPRDLSLPDQRFLLKLLLWRTLLLLLHLRLLLLRIEGVLRDDGLLLLDRVDLLLGTALMLLLLSGLTGDLRGLLLLLLYRPVGSSQSQGLPSLQFSQQLARGLLLLSAFLLHAGSTLADRRAVRLRRLRQTRRPRKLRSDGRDWRYGAPVGRLSRRVCRRLESGSALRFGDGDVGA